METITIRPRTEEQVRFFRDLLTHLRWDVEVEYGENGIGKEGLAVMDLRAEVLEAEEEMLNHGGIPHEELMEELRAWI